MYKGKFTATAVDEDAPKEYTGKKKRKTSRGTIVFYSIYLLLILAFMVGMSFVLNALRNWLVSYEAAQPETKCQQVFQELFADPDWEHLYTLAGVKDTVFEDSTAYASYMKERVGDTSLSYVETSAGLSGDKKYVVRAGSDKVATFTLTADNKDAEIPDWRLGTVEVFFHRDLDITIMVAPDCSVAINGVTLDDSYTLRTVTTTAEEYLPEGVHGYRIKQLYADGFLVAPSVTVTDAAGLPVELDYDSEERVYFQRISDQTTIGDGEYATVLTAAKTYCQFMIGAVKKNALQSCFDVNAPIYTTIVKNDTWMQSYAGYDFGEEVITDYYRYSSDLYSAKVTLTLNVTRGDGSVKPYNLNTTFFLTRTDDTWLVTEMTNVDVQTQTVLVRLQYMQDDTLLLSELVDASVNTLTPPAVTAPDGQVFSGWFTQTLDEDGNKTMSLTFEPDGNGVVTLNPDGELEPMTLYALFHGEGS